MVCLIKISQCRRDIKNFGSFFCLFFFFFTTIRVIAAADECENVCKLMVARWFLTITVPGTFIPHEFAFNVYTDQMKRYARSFRKFKLDGRAYGVHCTVVHSVHQHFHSSVLHTVCMQFEFELIHDTMPAQNAATPCYRAARTGVHVAAITGQAVR